MTQLRPEKIPFAFEVVAAGLSLGLVFASFMLSDRAGTDLTLIALALLISVVGAHLRFEVVVTAVVLATMFTGFSIPIAGINLRIDTLLMPMAVLSALVNGYGPQIARWVKEPAIQLLAAFVALNAITSYFNSVDVGSSLRIVIWYTSNLFALVFALACWGDQREKLLKLLFIGGAVNIVTGLAGWLIVSSGGNLWAVVSSEGSGVRTQGIAYEPNILAGICAIWVFLLIASPKLPLIQKLAVGGGFVAIFLTATRASLVALAVGLVVYFLFRAKYVLRMIPLLVVTAVGMFAVSVINPETYTGMMKRLGNVTFDNGTSTYRYRAWELAFNEPAGLQKLFGMGSNSYGQRHLDPTDPARKAVAYIGNLPLQTYYDVGWVGVALLGAVAVIIYRKGGGTSRHLRFSGLLLFLIVSTACSPFFFAYFWVFIGVGLARNSVSDGEKERTDAEPSATGQPTRSPLTPTARHRSSY